MGGRGKGGGKGRGKQKEYPPLKVDSNGRPLCPGHDEPCRTQTSRKDVSYGRRFWACARPHEEPPPDGQCKCFQWDDRPAAQVAATPAAVRAAVPVAVRFEVVRCGGGDARVQPKPPQQALATMVDADGTFSLRDHHRARQLVLDAGAPVVRGVPQLVRDVFASGPAGVDPLWDPVPRQLWSRLFRYQQQGVQFVMQMHGRAMIADEMGLGKTVQALAVVTTVKSRWPCLVICPASLRQTWEKEATNWLDSSNKKDFRVVKKASDALDGLCLDIISYDMCASMSPELRRKKYALIICDESHSIKNISTQRTQAVLPILTAAPHVLLLTGTPALSRPKELWPQLLALRGDLLPHTDEAYRSFSERYCGGFEDSYGGWDDCGSSHLAELQLFLNHAFMVRRLKRDHLAEILPDKVRSEVWVEIDSDQAPQMSNLLGRIEELKEKIAQSLDPLERPALEAKRQALDSRARETTGKAKLKGCCDHLKGLIASGTGKMLIFAHHTLVLDGLERFLRSQNIQLIRIDGQSVPASRQKMCDKFQEDPNITVALLSLKCGGTGLTLTAASTVIFAELDWTPGTLSQCEDRAHRVGQTATVHVKYLLCSDTLDTRIWQTLKRKFEVVNQTLDRKQDAPSRAPVPVPVPAPAPSIARFFMPPNRDQPDAQPAATKHKHSHTSSPRPLTPEQTKRVAQNREKALQRRADRDSKSAVVQNPEDKVAQAEAARDLLDDEEEALLQRMHLNATRVQRNLPAEMNRQHEVQQEKSRKRQQEAQQERSRKRHQQVQQAQQQAHYNGTQQGQQQVHHEGKQQAQQEIPKSSLLLGHPVAPQTTEDRDPVIDLCSSGDEDEAEGPRWEVEADHGWIIYNSTSQRRLRAAYATGTCKVQMGTHRVVDLILMQQQRTDTGRIRSVRRRTAGVAPVVQKKISAHVAPAPAAPADNDIVEGDGDEGSTTEPLCSKSHSDSDDDLTLIQCAHRSKD